MRMAPNVRSRLKRSLTVWLDCDLWVKLDKLVSQTKLDKTELIVAYLEEATKSIKLNEEDYKKIAKWLAR